MSANNTRLSPRQKMINLMYIVLTAMLALNVSSDVLNGFSQVEDGLTRSNSSIGERNIALYNTLEAFNQKNPEKGGAMFAKSQEMRVKTATIYNLIDSLKQKIVVKADGNDANINDIQNKDDLEAASYIMLSPNMKYGEKLRKSVDNYRDYICTLLTDPDKRKAVESSLSTKVIDKKGVIGNVKWEENLFDNMPVVAAVTLLTKLQSDIRYAEGEALHTLINKIDEGDVRVNKLDAFVIPNSRSIIQGGKYSADIVLAAIDTTQCPVIYINGNKLPQDRNGHYEVLAGAVGDFTFKGYLEVPHGDGSVTRHDFSSSYNVIAPTATISATMMNVMYAGIENPVEISAPGIPQTALSASMTNGTLVRKGNGWVARPSRIGEKAVITVTATTDGRSQTMGSTEFKVRKLPDPTAYIAYKDAKGVVGAFRGGDRAISKKSLMEAPMLSASIDDGILNIPFKVKSFRSLVYDSMGNVIPEVSDGGNFSSRQKAAFGRMTRGKTFFITDIKVVGPDGIERTLPTAMVVKVN